VKTKKAKKAKRPTPITHPLAPARERSLVDVLRAAKAALDENIARLDALRTSLDACGASTYLGIGRDFFGEIGGRVDHAACILAEAALSTHRAEQHVSKLAREVKS
jgi:hypothetical protein